MNTVGALPSLLCLIGLLSVGCAGVSREWKEAAQQTPPRDDISGAWEGTWLSQGSGHTGRLRCLMTKKSETEYEARFHATFWKIFSARYEVTLQATRMSTNDSRLEGTATLGGLMGGEYHYQGLASPTHFSATYKAEKDYGTFEMARPGLPESKPAKLSQNVHPDP